MDVGTGIVRRRLSAHVFPEISLFFKTFVLVALEIAARYNTMHLPTLHKGNMSKAAIPH